MKENYIIYKAQNEFTGDVYVGCTTKSIEERKKDHVRKANNGRGHDFHEAISTYGKDAFVWEQIDKASSVNELAQKEKKYIYEYNSKEQGYNSDAGAGFKIVKTSFSFAIFKECKVTFLGISNWVKNIFEFFILSIFLFTSSIVKVDGAPVITLIAFFPVFLSTIIPATPV